MIVDCLASLFGDFKFDGPAGFLLADGGAVDGIAMRCNGIDTLTAAVARI